MSCQKGIREEIREKINCLVELVRYENINIKEFHSFIRQRSSLKSRMRLNL